MKSAKLKTFNYLTVFTFYVGLGFGWLLLPVGYAPNPEISLGIVLCLISNNRLIPLIALAEITLHLALGLHNQLPISELFITTIVYSLSVVIQCWASNLAIRKAIGGQWKTLIEYKDIAKCALIVIVISPIIPSAIDVLLKLNTDDLVLINVALWLSDWLKSMASLTMFFPLFLSLYLRKTRQWKDRWKPIVIGSAILTSFFIYLLSNNISFQYLEQNISMNKTMAKITHDFEMQSNDLENSIELFTRVAENITDQHDPLISNLSYTLFKKFPEINAISININEDKKNKLEQHHDESLKIKFTPRRLNNQLFQTKEETYTAAVPEKYLLALNNVSAPPDYFAFFTRAQSPDEFQIISGVKSNTLADEDSANTATKTKLITIDIDKEKYLATFLKNISTNKLSVSIEQTSSRSTSDGDNVTSPQVIIKNSESYSFDKSLFQTIISINVFNTIWKIDVVPTDQWFSSRLFSQKIPVEITRLFMIVCFELLIFLSATRRTAVKILIAKQTATILSREQGLQIFKTSIQKSTDLIMICKVETAQNADPLIIYVNEFFQSRSGYSFQELINQPWSILQTNLSDLAKLNSVSQAIQEGNSHTVELLSFDKAGKWFWLSMSLSPIKDERDRITHWVFIQHEITERIVTELLLKKSAEDAHNANLAKSRFLAAMSHEIRTPIGGIIGLSRLARMSCAEDRTAEYLQKIQSSAELQLGVLNNILDYSKIESESLQLNITLFDLEKLLSESVDLYQPSAFLSGIELNLALPINKIKFVYGDWLRINQIVTNLIGNGLKFTQQGFVEIKLEIVSLKDQEVDLRISVIDTGIGIQGTTLAELLEPFKQSNNTIAENYGGTGLGLTITERLLRLMGSRLQMKPRFSGSGSHFYFDITLSMSLSDNDSSIVSNATLAYKTDLNQDIAQWKNAFVGKSILLAEDNKITQIVMQQYFDITGARVDIAADGNSVIHSFQSNHYDLIIMDLQLPYLTGIQACKKIRALPGGSNIPIFGVSAGITSNEADESLAAGMVDFLHKPVDPVILFTKLQRYFDKNSSLDSDTRVQNSQIHSFDLVERNSFTHQKPTINPTKNINALANEKLLKMFLDQASQIEHDILEKIRSKDFEHVQKILHEFQGTAAIFNELKLVTTARELENLIKHNISDRLKIDEFLSELKSSQDRILKSLSNSNRPVTSIIDTSAETTYKTTIEISPENNPTPSQSQPINSDSSVFRILIADDNEIVRQSLQQLLISVNIKVMSVSSGEEVLKQLLINDYDLILMDIRMPGLDGIDTTKRIRTQTALDHIVIIGMSADVSVKTVEICRQAGMEEVYSKLSRPELLITTINRFINN